MTASGVPPDRGERYHLLPGADAGRRTVPDGWTQGTAERIKTEWIKAEWIKTEWIKAEWIKTEWIKAERIKTGWFERHRGVEPMAGKQSEGRGLRSPWRPGAVGEGTGK